MRIQGIAAIGVVALAAAACGGGGGGSTGGAGSSGVLPTAAPTSAPTVGASIAPATNAPLPAGFAVANVKVTIPANEASSASSRRVQTVGTGTTSITFSLLELNGNTASATPQSYPLTYGSPGCSTNTSAPLVCSLDIDAPIGSDIFLAQTYNSQNALTGSGAVALSVALNATNTANLALSGQVASVFLAASAPYLGAYPTSTLRRRAESEPTFASAQVFVIAEDSANNVILNPSVYNTPIYLQLFYYSGTPDISLQVVPGSEGGITTSTSANYGFVSVNSPGDVVTASILPNVTNPASYAYIVGSIGPVVSSPAPIPTPTSGILPLPIYALPSGTIVIYDPGYGEQPQGGDVTAISLLGTSEHTFTLSETGYAGFFTLTDPTCAGIATLTASDYEIFATGLTVGSCAATISDALGNQLIVPVTVTTTSVTGS